MLSVMNTRWSLKRSRLTLLSFWLELKFMAARVQAVLWNMQNTTKLCTRTDTKMSSKTKNNH